MSGKSIKFDDKKVKKRNFCKIKTAFKIDDIDGNQILVSKGKACGTTKSFKHFIGPLCIMLP